MRAVLAKKFVTNRPIRLADLATFVDEETDGLCSLIVTCCYMSTKAAIVPWEKDL